MSNYQDPSVSNSWQNQDKQGVSQKESQYPQPVYSPYPVYPQYVQYPAPPPPKVPGETMMRVTAVLMLIFSLYKLFFLLVFRIMFNIADSMMFMFSYGFTDLDAIEWYNSFFSLGFYQLSNWLSIVASVVMTILGILVLVKLKLSEKLVFPMILSIVCMVFSLIAICLVSYILYVFVPTVGTWIALIVFIISAAFELVLPSLMIYANKKWNNFYSMDSGN
ncbi:MAG: hypothetical protein ACOYCB_08110 [Fastidiosipilaceae bacterium]|jgi:hypothetical protein|nr:hypothetical protein [Clostridiaceae bacterium]